MAAPADVNRDPLALLPSEIILNILDFALPSTLASLTRTSKAWHQFIDTEHQAAIYSSPRKTDHPHGATDFDYLSTATSFSNYFNGVSSWKDLCKRQTLLSHNWAAIQPETRESIVQVGRSRVWRFKPDFKRRFFLSTSHGGGMQVTDMDSGSIIWSVPSNGVRPFAHLEYQDGMAVWDRYGNALEVWKTDFPDGVRGEFRRVAVINHECETRGFQLAYNTLCVSSSEGEGFVYDLSQTPPVLKTHVTLPDGAMGHVYQDEHAVLFSMAERGFYFYEKSTGEFLGKMDGIGCQKYRHIKHLSIRSPSLFDPDRFEPRRPAFPPSNPRRDRLTPLHIEPGPLTGPYTDQTPIEEDDWGAGMIDGDCFVGLSKSGRILVCPQWRQALKDKKGAERRAEQDALDPANREAARRRREAENLLRDNDVDPRTLSQDLLRDFASRSLEDQQECIDMLDEYDDPNIGMGEDNASSFSTTGVSSASSESPELRGVVSHSPEPPSWTVIECEDDGIGFETGLGGWLAFKNNRFLCEMSGRIFIISLDDNGDVFTGIPERASWSLSTSSSFELKGPVSFMGLYDDCIMSTFSTLGWDSEVEDGNGDQRSIRSIFPTKAIRIVSFAPDAAAAGNQAAGLWDPSSARQTDDVGLEHFIEVIATLAYEVDGPNGGDIVFEEDDEFEDFEEEEEVDDLDDMPDLIDFDEDEGET